MSVSFYGLDYRHERPKIVGSEDEDVNLANENARAVLALLGLVQGTKVPGGMIYEGELAGHIPLPEARRAIMRGRSRFDKLAPDLERAEEIVYGKPREVSPGVVELRPVRVWSMGIDSEYLARQLERIAALIEVLDAEGATHLAWG